nr:substrate-binding domain-containing protein [Phytoactinopolyspora endophytica]
MGSFSTGREDRGRSVSPPLGAVVLARGREVLAKAEEMTEAIERFRAGEGRIDIGTFQSMTNVILPIVVRRLREEFPSCDIRLSEEEPEDPRIGDLDLLFYDRRLDGEVESVELLADPYLLVARAGAFPDGPVRVRQLDDEPMVAWPLTCDQPAMEQALARADAHPRIVFRTAGNEALLSMVRAGMGSAVVPWLAVHGAEADNDDRLRVHELRPTLPPRRIHLHWAAGRTHSPLATRAIEIAVEAAADLVPRTTSSRRTAARP